MALLRGGVTVLPWSGSMLLLAVLGLSALPPFGIFRSEFLIVYGGLSDPHYGLTAALVVLVTVAFAGMSASGTSILLTPPTGPVTRGDVSPWMIAPVVAALAVLLLLGVHPPRGIEHLLSRAVAELGGRG
jgi:hydrogenase-4 component F